MTYLQKMNASRFRACKLRAKPACALSPLFQALENLKLAMLSSGLERSDINVRHNKMDGNPGCFSGVAIKPPEIPEQGPPTKTYAAAQITVP